MSEGKQRSILRTGEDVEEEKSGGKSGSECQILRKLVREGHQGERLAVGGPNTFPNAVGRRQLKISA
jgi:hypothetical protein